MEASNAPSPPPALPLSLSLLGPGSVLELTASKAEARRRLQDLEQADVVAETYVAHYQSLLRSCIPVALILILPWLLSLITGSSALFVGALSATGAFITVAIVFAVLRRRWRRHDLENLRYHLAYLVLNVLGADIEDERPVMLRVDFTPTDRTQPVEAKVPLRQSISGLSRTMNVYVHPWFRASGRLRDDTRFEIRLTRQLKEITARGFTMRGKFKCKKKEKIAERARFRLRLPFAAEAFTARLLKHGWKETQGRFLHAQRPWILKLRPGAVIVQIKMKGEVVSDRELLDALVTVNHLLRAA